MRVLALDTTTRAGSAALVADGRIVEARDGDGARTHALRLPAEILDLANANEWPLASIDLYAVASGPGSFTGLRIGIATIQGLAFVHGRLVVAVPALEAIAYDAARELPAGARVGAWMDAHRGEIFAAVYEVGDGPPFSRARLKELEGATVSSPADALARWQSLLGRAPELIAGDGAALHRAAIEAASSSSVTAHPQLAGTIGLVAVDRAAEAREPAAVRPFYVRRAAVEVAREQQSRPG
jgi:tRNA threonylcarbamoyladenosine biosynthesis protein TsaB